MRVRVRGGDGQGCAGNRFPLSAVLEVSERLYVHSWDTIPHVARRHQWAILWRWLYLFEFQRQLSNQFHTSVITVTIRFLLRDLLIKRALNCECMVIETRLWCPIHKIYYEINVLISTVMMLWRHEYAVSYQKHICLEEWKPTKKASKPDLTDDSTSKYIQYHLLYTVQG